MIAVRIVLITHCYITEAITYALITTANNATIPLSIVISYQVSDEQSHEFFKKPGHILQLL